MHEFSRTEMLIGTEGLQKLRASRVLVAGVGGVGSHCIEALARAGVGTLILVDHDRVSLTNINRQSMALHSTVGRYKTEVMREKLLDINPELQVITHEIFLLEDQIPALLVETRPNYVVDAVDTVSAKLALAEQCEKRNIALISCMGTGNKLDPSQFRIGDVYETSVCPLCRVMRRELKKRNVSRLKVLYSKEQPVRPYALPQENDEENETKRAVPGSISFVPPAAGLLIAAEVVRDILRETQK